MLDLLIDSINVKTVAMVSAAIAAIATVLTFTMPLLAGDSLDKRMKAVAIEREKIRARERERMMQTQQKVNLRPSAKQSVQAIVDRFNLKKWVGQEEARLKLVQAGYRGQAPYVTYLFFRMVTPAASALLAAVYLFVVLDLHQPAMIKLGMCIAAAYIGMHAPLMFLKNRIARRQLSIKRAFPDTLDLLLICVESGMSIEAAFKKVSDEVGSQSVALAEELTLTTAELSYLQDRRQAYENLGKRTDLEGVLGLHGLAASRALRHAAGEHAARDGAGKSRHAHVGSREEGRRPAAEADRADDPVLPAGAVHRHSRTGRDQGHGDPLIAAEGTAIQRASLSAIEFCAQVPASGTGAKGGWPFFVQPPRCANICRR